jgi:hypothetical protein
MESPNKGFSLGVVNRETNKSEKARPEVTKPHTPSKAKVSKGKYSNSKPGTSEPLIASDQTLCPQKHITPCAE